MCDGECVWTYERMMKKTVPYCEWHSAEFIELLGIVVGAGWWMSVLALNDLMRYEWPN